MADGDDNKDSLGAIRPLFLAALAFVWALAFALLMLDLRSGGWRTIDQTSVVLLAFLLGISLLPFVSQFSIAGLFEFRRELGRLKGELQGIRNQVASLASASAAANQSAAQTQQLILAAGAVEEWAANAANRQAYETAAGIDVETPGTLANGSMRSLWDALWLELRMVVGLFYVHRSAITEGSSVLGDRYFEGVDRRFQRGTEMFLANEQVRDEAKRDLSASMELASLLESREASHPKARPVSEDDVSRLTRLLAYLHGYMLLAVGMQAAVFGAVLRDPANVRTFLLDLLAIIRELRSTRYPEGEAGS